MKEKLKEYALIAEIISALAIVASLIFVGLEVRQNTETLVISTGDLALESFNEMRTMIIQNGEVAEIISKMRNGEPLTDVEQIRQRAMCQSDIWARVQLYQRYLIYDEVESALGIAERFKNQMLDTNDYSCWEDVKESILIQGYDEFVDAVEQN